MASVSMRETMCRPPVSPAPLANTPLPSTGAEMPPDEIPVSSA
jgi:hypothetical protein